MTGLLDPPTTLGTPPSTPPSTPLSLVDVPVSGNYKMQTVSFYMSRSNAFNIKYGETFCDTKKFFHQIQRIVSNQHALAPL